VVDQLGLDVEGVVDAAVVPHLVDEVLADEAAGADSRGTIHLLSRDAG
jgi:hypothetical protein